MPPDSVRWRMCLDDVAIPFHRETLDFHDLHLEANGDKWDQEFLLLPIKATADMNWLQKSFKLPGTRWWILHQYEINLLSEMRQAIDSKKIKIGRGRRMPKLHKSIVAIRIRDKVIFVRNQSKSLCLAFKPGEEVETLQWFLKELEEDIKKLSDQGAEEGPQKQQVHKKAVGNEEGEVVKDSLNKVKAHAQCLQATFQPSRLSMRVIKKNKKAKEFVVKNLLATRKRLAKTGADETTQKEVLDSEFDKTVTSALVFLDEDDDAGDDDEDDDEGDDS
jgi:hypothetical protein